MADNLALLLERLGNLLRTEMRGAALQPVHLSALLYLSRANRYSDTPAGVTEYLGATKGTVSQSLTLLQQRGLIAGTRDEKDGRVTHLELTAAGKKELAAQWPLPKVSRALADLPEQERSELERSLTGLLTSLQKTNESRSFGVCNTCRMFERVSSRRFRCGLTGENLVREQTEKICREHSPIVIDNSDW